MENTIANLTDTGCKVPLLLYSDIELTPTQKNHLNKLKKKYIMFFYTDNINEVEKFCRMEQLITQYKVHE